MTRLAAFFAWLGTPFRAVRAMFPFTNEGRQTLIYLIFAGAGPALTLIGLRILDLAKDNQQWYVFEDQAKTFGWSLFIIVAALGMFVSIRAFKIGKDGLEFSSKDQPVDPVIAAKQVEGKVATAAKEAVAEVAVAAAQPATNTNPAGEPL
jgi:hypothetical protein